MFRQWPAGVGLFRACGREGERFFGAFADGSLCGYVQLRGAHTNPGPAEDGMGVQWRQTERISESFPPEEVVPACKVALKRII